jgi:hypothetical protein
MNETVELGYNDHRYNEFTPITNAISMIVRSQMITLAHTFSLLFRTNIDGLWVNFIIILRAHFLYKSLLSSFSRVTFWQKKTLLYKKCVRKMLMKLTKVDFVITEFYCITNPKLNQKPIFAWFCHQKCHCLFLILLQSVNWSLFYNKKVIIIVQNLS